ncbi:MAG: glycoside hydrolase family 88 protein [Verrucomicrobia bacterium]|nr:glycoside hydrolase family 88 protein [Verrucomicrobiota bacterium]
MAHAAAGAALDLAVIKARRNIRMLADQPQWGGYAEDGNYWRGGGDFFNIANWTSSFHTGMALLAWSHTEDSRLLDQVLRLEPWYRRKVVEHGADTMHDLGFLYSLYSVALYKITGDPIHRDTAVRAAGLLAGRFSPRGRFIRAWGRMDDPDPQTAGLAIIDCLMNLPLLYWAARETGQSRFSEVAFQHAETTRAHFIRSDHSVSHAFRFDPATGAPIGPANDGGFSVASHWARGTAWAIYGFALSATYTGERAHRDTALELAQVFIAQLDDEVVPVWDFRLPPGAPPVRDSSAAAIAACGLAELLDHGCDEPLLRAAHRQLLGRLCSPDYLDADEAQAGLLRRGQVGSGIPGVARSAYTSWGDYFFMEALARDLGVTEPWW